MDSMAAAQSAAIRTVLNIFTIGSPPQRATPRSAVSKSSYIRRPLPPFLVF